MQEVWERFTEMPFPCRKLVNTGGEAVRAHCGDNGNGLVLVFTYFGELSVKIVVHSIPAPRGGLYYALPLLV